MKKSEQILNSLGFMCLAIAFLASSSKLYNSFQTPANLKPLHKLSKNFLGNISGLNLKTKKKVLSKKHIADLWNHYEKMEGTRLSKVPTKRLSIIKKKKIQNKINKLLGEQNSKRLKRQDYTHVKKSIRFRKIVSSESISVKQLTQKIIKPVEEELNASEVVELYGFEVESSQIAIAGSWSDYFDLQNNVKEALAFKENLQQEDSISLGQSAPDRGNMNDIQKAPNSSVENFSNDEELLINNAIAELKQKAKTRKASEANDDLVVIDLSQDSSIDKTTEDTSHPLPTLDQLKATSPRVDQVIARELDKTGPIGPKVATPPLTTQKGSFEYPSGIVKPTLSSQGRQPALPRPVSTQSSKPHGSSTTLLLRQAFLGKSLGDVARQVSFIPAYDLNKRVSDHLGEGKIVLNNKLNNDESVLRGTLQQRGLRETKVDLTINRGKSLLEIPLITEDSLLSFLEREGLSDYGAYLLLDLSDDVDSIDLGAANFEAKIFLDDDFKVVKEEDDYRYIFFVGLNPGNLLIRYLTVDEKIAQKVIHLSENEIYYEDASFVDSAVESFLLYQRNIMGRSISELDLDEVDILFYNSSISPQKQSINRYEIRRPVQPKGTRSYLEFKHLGESIFLGKGRIGKLELPSRDFIQNAMDRNKIESLDGICMIQLNLSKKIVSISTEGETIKGPMNLEQTFLDRDGVMNYEASELATNAFLIGDLQGVINIKVEYEDESVDYLQTYCSPNTYLVEQL